MVPSNRVSGEEFHQWTICSDVTRFKKEGKDQCHTLELGTAGNPKGDQREQPLELRGSG